MKGYLRKGNPNFVSHGKLYITWPWLWLSEQWLQCCKFIKIRLPKICFSNLFKYFPVRYACIHNHPLGSNQPTAFAANVLQCRGGSWNPTTFKMKLFATIANGYTPLTNIAKCSILVMTGFMDLSLKTNNHHCWNVRRFSCLI